jgi:hypothetical protein
MRAHEIAVPDTELLATALPRIAWADAYAVGCGPGASRDPQEWFAALFRRPPLWVVPVLAARQALAFLCGIRRASEPPRSTDREVLVALDEGAFDCRMSLLREDDRVVLSTVGTPNDARGRFFLAVAGRVHPYVMRAVLTRAAAGGARECAEPETPLLAHALPRVDWSDAHAVPRPPGASGDPARWATAVFRDPPPWVGALLLLREALVGLVGIERAGHAAFDPVAVTADEVLLGIDSNHLDFRASVLCEPERTVVTTVVQLHNLRGRLYFALVRLVHPAIVQAMLDRAARRLSRTSNAPAPASTTMGA